jgi:hypothetical protein
LHAALLHACQCRVGCFQTGIDLAGRLEATHGLCDSATLREKLA